MKRRDCATLLDGFDDDNGLPELGAVDVLELCRYGVWLPLEVPRGSLEEGARNVAAIGDYGCQCIVPEVGISSHATYPRRRSIPQRETLDRHHSRASSPL